MTGTDPTGALWNITEVSLVLQRSERSNLYLYSWCQYAN